MRALPHDLDAERAVLAAVLLDARQCAREASVLEPEDFYAPEHNAIWAAIRKLLASESPVDGVLVESELQVAGKLNERTRDALGGAYARLPEFGIVGDYAARVRDLSATRAVIQEATRIASKGMSGTVDDVGAFLDDATHALAKAASARALRLQAVSLGTAMDQAFTEMVERAERGNGLDGYATGFGPLDRAISGIVPGDLIVIAGRPGSGKSSVAAAVLLGVSKSAQLPTVLFTLEMEARRVAMRVLSSEARVELSRLRAGRIRREEWETLTRSAGEASALPVYLFDQRRMNLPTLASALRACKREYGDTIGAVAVDYLQLMRSGQKHDNREQEVAEISRTLKILAGEESVPMIALAQLNRGIESRGKNEKRPQLSDLRESGAIEQDADTILFVHRPEMYDDRPEHKGITEIVIGKQRHGATGVVKMRWSGEFTRIDSLAEDYGGDDPHWSDR